MQPATAVSASAIEDLPSDAAFAPPSSAVPAAEESAPSSESSSVGDRASPRQPHDPGPIPNYELTTFVKSGGFGDVWFGIETTTQHPVAIKVIFDEHKAEREIAGISLRKAKGKDHPHLVSILTAGRNDRCFYYVMERADLLAGTSNQGQTLRHVLRERGRFGAREALQWTQKIAAAVGHLHANGVLHSDLKPENVLIFNREPKVGDFSLAQPIDGQRQPGGTPGYTLASQRPDDVFALGKVLYELVTGLRAADYPQRLPAYSPAENTRELQAALAIVNRACHPQADKRFKSVAELERQIHEALCASDMKVRRRRSRVAGGIAVLAFCAALGLSLAVSAAGRQAPPAAPPEVAWCIDRTSAEDGNVYTRFKKSNVGVSPARIAPRSLITIEFDYELVATAKHEIYYAITATGNRCLGTFRMKAPGPESVRGFASIEVPAPDEAGHYDLNVSIAHVSSDREMQQSAHASEGSTCWIGEVTVQSDMSPMTTPP